MTKIISAMFLLAFGAIPMQDPAPQPCCETELAPVESGKPEHQAREFAPTDEAVTVVPVADPAAPVVAQSVPYTG
jgi:hypothetical protein